jgi:hypothetical protein
VVLCTSRGPPQIAWPSRTEAHYMNKDELEKLQRELESFGAKYRNAPSPELEYHLTRLGRVLNWRHADG